MTDYYNRKIVVAIRTARAAAGWSQNEFVDKVGVSLPTICRFESLQTTVSWAFIMQAIHVFREVGIEVDLLKSDNINIVVLEPGIFYATQNLENPKESRKKS